MNILMEGIDGERFPQKYGVFCSGFCDNMETNFINRFRTDGSSTSLFTEINPK